MRAAEPGKSFQRLFFITLLFWSFGVFSIASYAQKTYTGEPVTKNGLIKALKMRQFQTADIVKIINENGVEFNLTGDVQAELVKAGARPELVEAVRRNYRGALKIKPNASNANNTNTYESLLSQANSSFEAEKNADNAVSILQRAVTLEPNKYRAYQMLGYVTLYGLRNFKQAEQYMRKAIELGGSAVFRVKHAHDYNFLTNCSGSLYISRGFIRFEDDENIHTFQVSDTDIVKIDTGGKWSGLLKLKGGIFNVVIRDRSDVKDKDKYQFSPLTGKGDEAKMIVRLVGK